MKCQLFCEPQIGMFLHQIPGGVTFSYNLYLGNLWGPWKGLTKEYNNKDYNITFAMVYHKHDPREWNANNFLIPKLVSWYINFLAA